jgi:hypothetical protein
MLDEPEVVAGVVMDAVGRHRQLAIVTTCHVCTGRSEPVALRPREIDPFTPCFHEHVVPESFAELDDWSQQRAGKR